MADSFVGWLPVSWVGAMEGIPECEAVADAPMGGAVGSHSQGFANMLAPRHILAASPSEKGL